MAQLRAIPTPMSSSWTNASSPKLGNTPIVRLYRGTMWAEGPAWSGVGRYLTWSDIPNNMQLRWLEEDGSVHQQFRYPSNNSNGNFFDYQGRQVACEHGIPARSPLRAGWKLHGPGR